MKTLTGVPRTQASRERVLPSLDHHPSDRVPIRFSKHSGTGIHLSCLAGIARLLRENRLVRFTS